MSSKIKDFTHEDMINANKKNLIYPIIFHDEVFLQISKYIPEIAHYYYVSNHGRVFSCVSGRICATHISNAGYEQVRLRTVDHIAKLMSVHRLVLMCFMPIPNASEMHVNHINGNKLDNRLINLEWVTQSENMQHCYRNNLEVNGVDHPWSTITEEQVHHICSLIAESKCDREISFEVFGNYNRLGLVSSIRAGNAWVNISQYYQFPRRPNHNMKRRFTIEELKVFQYYIELGMSPKEVAIASGIDIYQYDEKDRERIYRVIRNLRDKKAYKYLFEDE